MFGNNRELLEKNKHLAERNQELIEAAAEAESRATRAEAKNDTLSDKVEALENLNNREVKTKTKELDLLSSMALKMAQTLPKSGPTARVQQVARAMHQDMEKAIQELEKAGIDDRSKEKYPFDDRSVI